MEAVFLMKIEYIEFLYKVNADKIPHSKDRTLLDHLKGTYDLLHKWHMEEHVCVAGLFHSIYGNEHFIKKLISINKRKKVANIIGPQSEKLIYYFNICNRKNTIEKSIDNSNRIIAKNNNTICFLSKKQFQELMILLFANELEQAEDFLKLNHEEKFMLDKMYSSISRFLNEHAISSYMEYTKNSCI